LFYLKKYKTVINKYFFLINVIKIRDSAIKTENRLNHSLIEDINFTAIIINNLLHLQTLNLHNHI